MQCSCGCGQDAPIATKTDSRRGHVKGEPMRFCPGHSSNNGKNRTIVATVTNAMGSMGAEFFEKLERMGDVAASALIDSCLRDMEKKDKRRFAERGLLLVEAERRELWREIFDNSTGGNYVSMEQWIVGACPFSRSDCFAAKRCVSELREIPIEHLLNIPRCNLMIMVKLSTKVRKAKAVLTRAESLSEKEFIQWLGENYPDQHIEPVSKMNLAPTTSARKVIDEVVDIGRWAFEVEGREESMEAVMNDWADSPANMEGYEGLTHREAFEKHQKMMDDEEGAA